MTTSPTTGPGHQNPPCQPGPGTSGATDTGAAKTQPTTSEFIAAAATPEYGRLRRAFRRFAFPMTVAGLASYFVYVILSIYATEAMAKPLFGSLNVGMTLGLFQFLVTYVWTAIYVRYANRRLDPIAADLKARLVGEEHA
ncbi:DUF485 domain-containing protein [Tessaracoccus sp. HDW20]|uniref:DUF485 domain-containing protein n=1 Tax=Tessaracoccus coleopterorum TaxID=2714950 RepID=UPI0018D28C79|nr:DUF485 domain-containing protein [Tessaracoccus coleopterorum]